MPTNRALDPSTRAPMGSSVRAPVSRPVEPVNRVNDPNAWRNQATTYQPLPVGPSNPPSSEKPIPDSIINSLTQRVNNKSRPSSANNSSGRWDFIMKSYILIPSPINIPILLKHEFTFLLIYFFQTESLQWKYVGQHQQFTLLLYQQYQPLQ